MRDVRIPLEKIGCVRALVLCLCLITGGVLPNLAFAVGIAPAQVTLTAGQTQQFTLKSIAGSSSCTWSVNGIAGGSQSTGTISAKGLYTAPADVTTSSTVTVEATIVSRSVRQNDTVTALVSLEPPPLVVTPYSAKIVPSQSQRFSAKLANGSGPDAVAWSISPQIGSISADGLYTAPESISTTQEVTVTATASGSAPGNATVAVEEASPLAIVTSALPGGTTGVPYSAQIEALGGVPPLTWSLKAGEIPAGLNLSTTTGLLSGIPTAAGTYATTVEVKDSLGKTASAALAVSILLCTGCDVKISSLTLPSGTVGLAYSAMLAATGGKSPYTWSLASGQLPPGLTLANTGLISGNPSAAGAYNLTVQAMDSAGMKASQALAIAIAWAGSSAPSDGALTILNADLPNGTVASPYSATLTAAGGQPPYKWSVGSGSLPAGLTLNSATGEISGTPASPGWSQLIELSAQDSAGTRSSLSYSFVVNAPLDQYGGYLGQTCTATGKFHTQKIGNRWWFCDPAGYVYWNLSVGAVGGQDASGSDSKTGLSYNMAATNTAKYGDLTYNWGVAQNRRLQQWGFNGVGQFSSAYVKPTTTGFNTADGTQPVKLPMTDSLVVSNYAGVNLWGYGTRPLKNLAQGYSDKSRVWVGHGKAIMDYLDSAFQTYVSTYLAKDAAVQSYKQSPYLIGLFLDDTDWSWGFGAGPDFPTQPSLGHNNSSPAYEVIVTSPVQRFQPNPAYSNFGVMYSDGRVFSKVQMSATPAECGVLTPCSLRDYLYKKYNGNIAALNSAWGSNYTSFDSTGKSYTGIHIGTGDGSNRRFDFTLPDTPVSPYSVAVYVNGMQVGGDCPYYNTGCNAIPNLGSFMSPQGAWSPGQVYAETYIVDPNGNLQRARNNGNNGATPPKWATTQGSTTLAGEVVWENLGPSVKSGSGAPWSADSQLTASDCADCGLPPASYWFQMTWHGAMSAPSRVIGGTFTSGAPRITITTQNNANDAPTGVGSIDLYVSCRVLNGPASHGCVASTDPEPAPTLQASGIPYPNGSWIEPSSGLIAGSRLPQPPSLITYGSGQGSISFNSAPAAGAVISVDYIANGWPYGTGLMDEDGRNTVWLGTNDVCLTPHPLVCGPGLSFPSPNANPTTGADLEGWNAQFAASYFSQSKAAMTAQLPGVLYFGTDTLGTWGAPPPLGVLQGAAPYIDAMFTTIYPGQTYSDTIYGFVTQYLGDKPMMNFLTEQATADSFLSAYGQQSQQVIAAPTQEQRGQNWRSTISSMLSALSYNGTYQWIGANWWGLYDFWSEKTNWGLVSLLDNPYDGRSSCQRRRVDLWGNPTGGESPANGRACFGSAIDYVKDGNSLPYTFAK